MLFYFNRVFLGLLISISWGFSTHVFGQNQVLDSLKVAFMEATDSSKVILAGELFWQSLLASKLVDADSYAKEELLLANSMDWPKGKAQSYNDLGMIQFYQKEYSKALEYYDSALTIRKEIMDLKGVAAIYNKQGLIYQNQGRFEAFIESQQMALAIFEQINDSQSVGVSLNNLGDGYFQIRAYEKAIEIHKQALKIRHQLSDSLGLATTYLNLGNCYLNDSTAKRYFLLALPIFLRLNDSKASARVCNNLSITYLNIGELVKAEMYALRSIKLKTEIGDQEGLANSYMSLSDILLHKKEFYKSMELLVKASRIFRKLGLDENFEYIYYYKSEIFYKMGNSDSAYIYQKKCNDLKNALYTDELYSQVAEMRTRYETEKREDENILLAKENELAAAQIEKVKSNRRLLMIFSASIIIIIIILGMLLSYMRRLTTEKRITTIEKKNFTAVINAEEKERTRIARELHDGLGQMLSTAKLNVASLEPLDKEEREFHHRSLNLIDEAVTEVRAISHNLMPIALTKGGLVMALEGLVSKLSGKLKLELKIGNMKKVLTKPVEIAIYRVVQEFVNNCIKHAEASHIKILLESNENMLFLSIADNGVGFDTNSISESSGLGWKNIFSRISLLNGEFKIQSMPNQGTELKLNIPIL